jgi:hypothetical protein
MNLNTKSILICNDCNYKNKLPLPISYYKSGEITDFLCRGCGGCLSNSKLMNIDSNEHNSKS